MLIVRKRNVVHIPVVLLAMFGPVFVFSIVGYVNKPKPAGFIAPLIVGGVFVLVLLQICWIVPEGNALRVRTLFGHCTLDRTVSIAAVSVRHSARGGPSYSVYVDDGTRQASVSEHSSAAAAHDAADQLQAWIAEGVESNAALDMARSIVRRRAFQAERARLDRYFDPERSRRTMIVILAITVLAAAFWTVRRVLG